MKIPMNSNEDTSSSSLNSAEQSNQQVFLMDLRNSLAHELGHYVVADYYKGSPKITIWRSDVDDCMGKLTVIGNCSYSTRRPLNEAASAGRVKSGSLFARTMMLPMMIYTRVFWISGTVRGDDFSRTDISAITAYADPEESLKCALTFMIANADILRTKSQENSPTSL